MAEVTARNGSRQVGQRFAALETIEKAAALLDIVGRTEDHVVRLAQRHVLAPLHSATCESSRHLGA